MTRRGIELFVLCFLLPSLAVILCALHDERKRKLAARAKEARR
jgi:hypothetical protein